MLIALGFIIFILVAGPFVRSLLIRDEYRHVRITFYARALVIATFVAVSLYYGQRIIDERSEQAFQSELRSEVRHVQDSQETFFKEYLRYAKKSEEIAYHPSIFYSFYFSEQDFPIYLKHNLDQKDWPYANNNDYQFVIEVHRHDKALPEILIQPKTGPLRGLQKK